MANVTIIRLQDKYNSKKVWVIKRYSDGHYYLNQEINGKMFYKRFTRVSRAYIEQLFADGEGFYESQLVQKEAHFIETAEDHKGRTKRIALYFDTDEEFFRFTKGMDMEYVHTCHNTARIGNKALCRDGSWKAIRG